MPQIVAGAYVLGESDGSQSTVEVGGTQFNAMRARGIGDDVRLHERSKALEDRTPRADPAWNKAGKLEADESITRLRKPEGATRFGVGSSVPFHAAASSGEYAVGAETSWKESWSKPAHSWRGPRRLRPWWSLKKIGKLMRGLSTLYRPNRVRRASRKRAPRSRVCFADNGMGVGVLTNTDASLCESNTL